MPVRDAGRRSGCACETAPGASADVRRRKPSGVAVANPLKPGCSRPLSTSTEGKASRRPGELSSDLLGEKSGVKLVMGGDDHRRHAGEVECREPGLVGHLAPPVEV